MEFPDVGKHCSHSACNKLDFLPIRCDACSSTFCNEHYSYTNHSCQNAYKKNNQVPVCPLCNYPVPVSPGLLPDQVVGAHIDNDCQSAKERRKVFTNKCSLKGCKAKEVVPLVCVECKENFCLKHRHPQDHKCEDNKRKRRRPTVPKQTQNFTSKIHGNMSEDEALAKALALSMQETSAKTQEELDFALARQLQAAESQTHTTPVGGARNRDRCIVS